MCIISNKVLSERKITGYSEESINFPEKDHRVEENVFLRSAEVSPVDLILMWHWKSQCANLRNNQHLGKFAVREQLAFQ